MAIPEDHLAKFHKITDAKEMWEAIKSRFGRNDESTKMHKYILKQQFKRFYVSNSEGLHKGYDRFQSLLSQLETYGASISIEDANQNFLRSLPSSWSQVSLIMRTKPGVDTLSFDDLYNNLIVFEFYVKGSTGSSSSIQNVPFVSSNNTSSTNEVNTAYGVSTSSSHNSQREGSSSYTDELMHSFFANQSSGPKLDYEDLEQLDEFDLKEMDLKWRDTGNTRHKERDNRRRPAKHDEPKAMVTIDGYGVDWTGHAEDDTEDYALMAFSSSNSGSDFEVTSCSKDDIEDSPVNDRFAKVERMHAVPPPIIGIYMPHKSNFGIDESKFTYDPKQFKNSESDAKTNNLASCDSNSSVETLEFVPKPVESKPKAVSEPKVWFDASIIKEFESDSDDEFNAARQKFSSQAASTSTVRKATTTRQMVNDIRPRDNLFKSHVPIRWPFNRTTAPKSNFTNHKVNNVKNKTVSAIGGNRETAVKASADNPHQTLKGKGIVDSGCSRHMTENKAYLVEYQDFNGGPVAFLEVKTIRCDNDTKFKNREIIEFYASKGIKREYSNARTPQQNRFAETNNMTLIEAARTMLADSVTPPKWVAAE
nr:hypothetical protein [Tanacetum cinerariifolium]